MRWQMLSPAKYFVQLNVEGGRVLMSPAPHRNKSNSQILNDVIKSHCWRKIKLWQNYCFVLWRSSYNFWRSHWLCYIRLIFPPTRPFERDPLWLKLTSHKNRVGGFCEADFESGVYQLQSRLEELPELFVVKHSLIGFRPAKLQSHWLPLENSSAEEQPAELFLHEKPSVSLVIIRQSHWST